MEKALREYVDYFESFKTIGIRPYENLKPIRPISGDYIHILLKQDIEFSIIALSPKKYAPYMYSWGKFVGVASALQAMKATHMTLLVKLLRSFWSKMGMLKLGTFYENFVRGWIYNRSSIPMIQNINEELKRFEIISEECDEASGLPKIGKKVCFYDGAVMAGNIEAVLGKPVNVTEKKCVANGDERCVFRAVVDSGFPDLDIPSKSDFEKIKKSVFNRMFKRSEIRPRLGNYSHLAPFQLTYIGIWTSSPGAHTMLYWIGKNSGVEIGKRIKEKKFEKRAEEFRKILEYLKVGIINKLNKKEMVVEESAFAAGAKNFHKKICSYLAGLYSGFLSSSGINKNVIETKCIANGDGYCKFETI